MSNGATPTGFVSPLLVTDPDALTAIDFGHPPASPAIDALAARLDAEVLGLAASLPPALRQEAEAALRGYGGGQRLFIELFYRPVWSFLHWLPAADPEAVRLAGRVQAMSLFLHLWDDHLSDGQLAPDLVRLHLRSLAWQAYAESAERLRVIAAAPTGLIEPLVAAYLETVHRPGVARSLSEHAERMVQQVGIWRVAPLLYGRIVAGPAGGAALCRVVERFSIAWRLIDDVQDAAEDVRSGQQNALNLALDEDGRAAWHTCRAHSAALPRPEAQSWAAVGLAMQRGGLADVLARADAEVAAAMAAAAGQGWTGLAAELAACRI